MALWEGKTSFRKLVETEFPEFGRSEVRWWFRKTGKIYAPVRLRSSDNLAFHRQIIRIFRATKPHQTDFQASCQTSPSFVQSLVLRAKTRKIYPAERKKKQNRFIFLSFPPPFVDIRVSVSFPRVQIEERGKAATEEVEVVTRSRELQPRLPGGRLPFNSSRNAVDQAWSRYFYLFIFITLPPAPQKIGEKFRTEFKFNKLACYCRVCRVSVRYRDFHYPWNWFTIIWGYTHALPTGSLLIGYFPVNFSNESILCPCGCQCLNEPVNSVSKGLPWSRNKGEDKQNIQQRDSQRCEKS